MNVVVNGAAGRMGQEVVKAVTETDGMKVVGGVVRTPCELSVPVYTDLTKAIEELKPDAVVDFTNPNVVRNNIEICLKAGVRMVVGTTGLQEGELQELSSQAEGRDWGALIAPNFAIGAVLMMRFATEAAHFFPDVEIIEFHHEQKKDAPSGTAIKTAEMIKNAAKAGVIQRKEIERPQEWEKLSGARGANWEDIRIHSVRLPGYVAHQEVILGLPGQTLTIRHDSTHRESFMPGVIMALQKLHTIQGIVYGLEHILFD